MRDLMKKMFLSLLIGVFLFGCAGTQKGKTPAEGTPSASQMDETFDPLSLNDEDLVFEQVVRGQPAEQEMEQMAVPETTATREENKLIDGYRVQLISTKDLEGATKFKQIVSEQFADLDYHFYIEFDSPYYKVRMGDFKSREEAQQARQIVQSRGYPKAFIVKTKVWSNPASKPVNEQQNFQPPDDEN